MNNHERQLFGASDDDRAFYVRSAAEECARAVSSADRAAIFVHRSLAEEYERRTNMRDPHFGVEF